MKLKRLAIAVVAFALGGCALLRGQDTDNTLNPPSVSVSLADGRIIVPSVVVFTKGTSPVAVTWQLPADSKLRFAENGIVIEGRLTDELVRGNRPSVVLDTKQNEIVDCKPAGGQGLAYACINKRTQPGVYKYTIRLTDGKREIIQDPSVVNW